MKKRIALLLVLAMLLSVLAACSNSAPADTSSPADTTTAVTTDTPAADTTGTKSDVSDQLYLCCTYNSTEYYQRMLWAGFQEAAEMLGVKAELVGDTGEDVMKYLTKLDTATSMDPDGIAVMCLDGDAYVDGINKAMDQGIPVVTIAPDSPNSERISYMGVDYVELGSFAASVLTEKIDGKGEVLYLTKLGFPDCEEMLEGFERYCDENSLDVTTVVVPASLDLTDQTAKAAAAISANPNINAAYCPLGWQAVAVYQACEELGIEPFPILGTDCELAQLELVRDGKIMGCVRQGVTTQGFWACLSLYLLKNNYISEAFFPAEIFGGYDIVDQSNVEEEIAYFKSMNP